jgi:hypothetical protein
MKRFVYLFVVALGFVLSAIEIPMHVDAALPALAICLTLLGLLGYSSARIARLEQTVKSLQSRTERPA